MIPVWHYLAVAATLFGIGLIGFLTRRNLITMFLSAELMLQGVLLNAVAFSKFHGNLSGQVLGLVIVSVAACEAGLCMALIIVVYRQTKSLDATTWQDLREEEIPATIDLEPLPVADVEETDPRLPIVGAQPGIQREISHV